MAKPSKLKLWIAGARVRTLTLAVAPVALGSGAAAVNHKFNPLMAGLALAVALLLQIGVNYSNDYSDGIRGTDANRVGPLRLTGSKSVPAKQVRNAALISFAAAAILGLVITWITGQWWFIAVGAAAIAAAWFYTGGKNPYGYAGLGEIVVFIFFGLVATVGTTYIQTGNFNGNAVVGGAALGCLASAVLLVNNIRDLPLDKQAGKKTLAVMIGKTAATALFIGLLWLPFAILLLFVLLYPATFMAYLGALLAIPITMIVVTAKKPAELVTALKLTSYTALIYGVLLGWGLALINFS
jgi:1,4-dihydroxy-2-naphthoate octaprenyltransferase